MQERKELSLQDCESEITEAPKVPMEKNTKSTRAKSLTKAAVVIDLAMIVSIFLGIIAVSDTSGCAMGVALFGGFMLLFGIGACAWLQLLVMILTICALCAEDKTKAIVAVDVVLLIIASLFVVLPPVFGGSDDWVEIWLLPLKILRG